MTGSPRHCIEVLGCNFKRLSAAALLLLAAAVRAGSPSSLSPIVEAEETVYTNAPANNGAGPMWCSGSTCLVRAGEHLFASGIETIENEKPLNNCRWLLFKREGSGWRLEQADPTGRTREPSPLAAFPDGRFFLSANPTLTAHGAYSGPAQPEILQFKANDSRTPFERLLPAWDGNPQFTEHSYRSFAADGPARELILFQNIGYTHAEWTFRDREGKWTANGKLPWPEGADYPKPGPIRVCYPNVALKNRAVHFCGVSDIVEPYPEWRAFKKQLTGQEWDYDFRRLFYTWTPDITREKFRGWVEIASRDKTCGWVSPGDLWVAPDGAAHIVWTERALDERLRSKFFPEAKQSHAINYAVVRDGKVALRRTLLLAEEGNRGEIPSAPRFQITPDNRLFLCYYVQGTGGSGKAASENRLMEILAEGRNSAAARIPFKRPFVSYFTTTVRGGSPPSAILEVLGIQEGKAADIAYGRVRLW
ncbi:MAG TPA: hypothetical protein VJA21_12385 [Verrucomicrobiae bacterium]